MAKSSRFLSAASAKKIDTRAREALGISTLVLMENAGRAVAEEAMKMLGKSPKPVAIFCGRGNNGGDGLVAARHLLAAGIRPRVFLAGRISQVKNEAGVNLGILLKLKQKISEVGPRDLPGLKKKIARSGLIIDALLGVGLKGEVRGVMADLIRLINAVPNKVLAVDIPSGLDSTSGNVLGGCVRADKTVTFVAQKQGMARAEGARYCGKIIVKGLGAPL
jgi:NAD(P)H-hydrate epimerase